MAKKSDLDLVTEEKIRSGGVLVKLYFDIQDKDKDKLQPLLTDLINNRLMKAKGVVYCYGKILDPIGKDDMFITSAIVTVLTDSIGALINVMFNYAPAGLEVLKPEKEVFIKTAELQSLLLDISNISLTYSKYILERVMDKDEAETIRKQLENRAEMGKRLIEDSNKEGKDQPSE
ncbi:hypothetical protein B2A_11861 [mine drainage metagenome]|uniref:Uncharacterized protein n=1 Tax=mine drainage metagenome TaxID=410659 RepID=T0YVR3_9ZZZZ